MYLAHGETYTWFLLLLFCCWQERSSISILNNPRERAKRKNEKGESTSPTPPLQVCFRGCMHARWWPKRRYPETQFMLPTTTQIYLSTCLANQASASLCQLAWHHHQPPTGRLRNCFFFFFFFSHSFFSCLQVSLLIIFWRLALLRCDLKGSVHLAYPAGLVSTLAWCRCGDRCNGFEVNFA